MDGRKVHADLISMATAARYPKGLRSDGHLVS